MMSSRATVFVVDDDPAAMESVVALLEAFRYPCQGFTSARAFLQDYDSVGPACLVTDLAMPGMTGLELHCELRARGSLIPTIVVSGYVDVSQTVKLMQHGAVTVLEKPCQQDDLIEATGKASDSAFELWDRTQKLAQLTRQFAQLTAVEHEVLDRLIKGQSNKTMAFELGVCLRTIEFRRQRIYHKFEVDTVAQLVARVAEREHLEESSRGLATLPARSEKPR